jgi:hypothetical protein
MSAPKLLDRFRAKQAENLVAREYSDTPPIPPADGLQRRGAFIMPTRETLPAYRAHFEAKAAGASTQAAPDSDRQTERIRRLAATVTPDELLSARKRIKATLQKSLSETDLHELALTLAHAEKREKSLRSDETRPAEYSL